MVKDASVSEKDIQRFKDLWIDKVDRIRIYEEHSVGGVYGATRTGREPRKSCFKPFTDIVIYWDGKVVRCNHDWSKNTLGDINNNTIRQIWNGPEFKRIRSEQLSLEFSEDVCRNCDSWYAKEGSQGTGYAYSKK